jgi:CBS domain-containing protein
VQWNTSISRVAALMAYERVHHVVVVDAEQRVIGIVSALDIARWVAHADGYVVPKRKRRSFDD